MQQTQLLPVESHPWPPFIPDGARILIMGTFPPGNHRWSMDFYYPNATNDFWYMMGLIFMGDRNALKMKDGKGFDLDRIKQLLQDTHIALNDTAREVRRLRGNASDKFLEIITPVPLFDLLSRMPHCHAVATTGEKAAGVIADITGTRLPKMGEKVEGPDGLSIYRMPSTSRAYPMRLEDKARYYADMFRQEGIL